MKSLLLYGIGCALGTLAVDSTIPLVWRVLAMGFGLACTYVAGRIKTP